MRNPVITILKKELARFFGDKRMAFTTVLLPGLLIFVLYNFMGSALAKQFSVSETYKPTAVVQNLPDALGQTLGQALELRQLSDADAKRQVTDQELDLYLAFPADFDAAVAAYDPASGTPAPNVEVYFNSASTASQQAYTAVLTVLDQFESSLANKFDVNRGGSFDLVTAQDQTSSIFSSMLPMLLMIFLFSGCIAVAPESIAGEKERGTIATMLVTPAKRSSIALGKIIALSIIALLSGISSALGTILSLPSLMGSAGGTMSGAAYGPGEYVLLGVVILSTVLLLVTLISIISAFAKSTKEAQTYVMPLMILVMLLGVTAMFGGGAKESLFFYLIPLYNSVQCMVSIFSFEMIPAHILAAVAANLVYTGLGIFLLAKMFNSERIVFSK